MLLVSLGPASPNVAQAQAQADDVALREARQRAKELGLADERMWHVLLHYHSTIMGGVRSSADGSGFFLAGEAGETQPEAELLATLDAFASPPKPPTQDEEASQHPQCRFPARWTWLKERLGLGTPRFPEQPCPVYARWRQAISPEKVALIFSSAYISSPASMYGHTFLRLTRKTGQGNKLIDYIVNFAADADTANGLSYAVKGLFGGFNGLFYVMPYYMKIQEYSNLENRDLWEYPLSLSSEQSERLVAHTWEARTTWFNYYFATENCSYFILELLEVANPDLHLTSQMHGPVVPVETLRAVLSVPGLVEGRSVRPSLREELLARKSRLSWDERSMAKDLAKNGGKARERIAGLEPARQALVIDAAYALMRFREGITKDPSEEFKEKEQALLVLRGRTGMPPVESGAMPSTAPPETSHRPVRIGLGMGAMPSNSELFWDLTCRLALQDFLDRPRGMMEDAQLEMGQIRVRYERRGNYLFPERFDFVNILSAPAWDSWVPKMAWKIRSGANVARQFGCQGEECWLGGVDTGGGIAFRLGRPLLAYLMTDAEVSSGPVLHDYYRIGLGGFGGLALRLGNFAQTDGQVRYDYYLLGDRRRGVIYHVGQAINFGRHAQGRVVLEGAGEYREARVELMMYL